MMGVGQMECIKSWNFCIFVATENRKKKTNTLKQRDEQTAIGTLIPTSTNQINRQTKREKANRQIKRMTDRHIDKQKS